jgi:hypothetical protein
MVPGKAKGLLCGARFGLRGVVRPHDKDAITSSAHFTMP